jgi:Endonuclease/Exonuclease/phosphatase family
MYFGQRRRHMPRLRCEALEDRTVPSTVRIVTYNIAADVNGFTTPRPGLYQVLEGIGEEQVQGHFQPLDVLALQETTSNSTTVAPIVTNLNSYYNGLAMYAQSPYQATQSGSNTVGNGPNALVYNTTTLNLLASVGVGTPQGSGNGEYRQVVRYKFQPVGATGSAGIFYLYDSHSKAGTGSTNANLRNEEAQIIRNDEAANLPADARVLYVGDFNLDGSSDASYQTLAANTSPSGVAQGAGFDPLNRPGNWATNPAFQDILTESSTNLRFRDDLELVTQNVQSAAAGGLGYVSGSYHTFGVNGSTPEGGSVNNGSNTALNNNLVQDGGAFISASTLYSDLTTASDHLPVVADFTVPTSAGSPVIGSFTISPTSVQTGGSFTLTASNVTDTGGTISSVTFYRESNGTNGLQVGSDTLVGSGTQNGTTWTLTVSTTGLTAGTYTFYAVATDTNGVTSTPASTTLTVTNPATSGVLVAWDVNGQSNYGTQGLAAAQVASGVSNSLGLTRASGVGTSGTAAGNAWGGNNWAATSSAGISGSQYVTFGLTVAAGEVVSLSSLDLHYRHSSTGPTSGYWQYQLNGGAWTLIGDFANEFPSTSTSGADITEINLTGIAGLQNLPAGTVANVRLVPYGSTGSAGTWYVYDHTGNDLVVNGTVSGGGVMMPGLGGFSPTTLPPGSPGLLGGANLERSGERAVGTSRPAAADGTGRPERMPPAASNLMGLAASGRAARSAVTELLHDLADPIWVG